MPRIADELRKRGASPTDPAAAKAKRQSRAAKRKELPTREIFNAVPEEKRCCPKCGGGDLRALGEGKQSVVYEYVSAHFERQVHVQETLACRCGEALSPRMRRSGDRGRRLRAPVFSPT